MREDATYNSVVDDILAKLSPDSLRQETFRDSSTKNFCDFAGVVDGQLFGVYVVDLVSRDLQGMLERILTRRLWRHVAVSYRISSEFYDKLSIVQ